MALQWDNYVEASTADVHAPASNTAAVVTYAAPTGQGQVRHVISGIAWSYDAAPTGGALTVGDGTSTFFSMAVTAAGAGIIVFPRPKAGARSKALVVTLAAGGSGVTGKVSVLNHWME